jgi:hypothetical protein
VILHLLQALRAVEDRVTKEGSRATLSVELLLQLPGGATALRHYNEDDEDKGGKARGSNVRAEHLALVIEQACRWFSMPSIAELNPVEQAALAFLRLVEIAPFEAANERLALVAASLFTMRRGLPPLIIAPANARQYHDAVNEGRRMNTQPLVDLLAIAVEQALDAMTEFVLKLRDSTASINRDRI